MMIVSQKFIFLCAVLLSLRLQYSECIEPISATVATVGVVTSVFAGYEMYVKCRFMECCDNNWIRPNITGLRAAIEYKVHGQHLVIDSVVKAVAAHVRQKAQPSKALVLSFHGWTGCGKNFVSNIIAEHLYVKGMKSKYVHLFIAELHFPHKDKIETYKSQLRRWITGNVTSCETNLFIFDEMDKMHPGIIDAIKPFIDNYPEIDGVDFRKSIFIFLSNTAGNAITMKSLQYWEAGKDREDIQMREMEEEIHLSAFNEQGGLWHSSLLEKNMIDVYIPFLPMERKHVKMCIRDDLRSKGYFPTENILNKVASELQYFPEERKLFSKSGCKRVPQKVDVIMEEILDDM